MQSTHLFDVLVRNAMTWWKVFDADPEPSFTVIPKEICIDEVCFQDSCDEDYVLDSLINHDGYSSTIRIERVH